MQTRTWSSVAYRFGFNGQEMENEILGTDGAHLVFEYRIHNSSLGRFLGVDPLLKEFPWNSTYAFAENRPIDGIDLEGLEYAKPPNKEARTLLIVPDYAGQIDGGYSWNIMYSNALKNNNVDVVKVQDVASLVKYTSEIDKKYATVYFADHGTFPNAGQVIGNYQYNEAAVTNNANSFKVFADNSIQKDGNIVLLGCFTAAPQYDGVSYISTFSETTGRIVYGNQGETYIGYLFKNSALGGGSTEPSAFYYGVAQENAGQWSMAKPDGTVNQEIGNLKVNSEGALEETTEIRNPPTDAPETDSQKPPKETTNSKGNSKGNSNVTKSKTPG